MSARGWLVKVSDSGRSDVLAESKRYIPLAWPCFLSAADLARAEAPGLFRLDKKAAVERAADRLPFLASLFPEAPGVGAAADGLVQAVRRLRCPAIGIEVTDLLEDDPALPGLAHVVGAFDARDAAVAFTVPARVRFNPITRAEVPLPPLHLADTRALLLAVCLLRPGDLADASTDDLRETVNGHVWKK